MSFISPLFSWLHIYIYIYIYIYMQSWKQWWDKTQIFILLYLCYLFIIDGEIKLKYLYFSEFHVWKQSAGISYLFYLKRNEQNTSIWNTKMRLQNLRFFNYVFLTLFKRILFKCLFKCLHLLINSNFLFNQFSSLIELIIQSFSVKQRVHPVEFH